MTAETERKELAERIDAEIVDCLDNLWWAFDIGRDDINDDDKATLATIRSQLRWIAERAYAVNHSIGA